MRNIWSLLVFVCLGVAASMRCKVDSKGLKAYFTKVSGANYYEVQIASSPTGPPFAAEATEAAGGGYVHIYGAIKGKTYYVRLRSHASNNPTGKWRLLKGWSNPGSWYKCEYKKTNDANDGSETSEIEQKDAPGQLDRNDTLEGSLTPQRQTTMQPQSQMKKYTTFNLGVVRQAKLGLSPDYLDEKNAAGYGCDATYAHQGSLIQLFCVEIMKVTLDKAKVFSYDDKDFSHYANYLSCNLGGPDYTCTPMVGADCGWFKMTGQGSRCQDIDANTQHSLLHVGRGQRMVGSGWDQHFNAYSFPAKTECREHEDVGTKNNGVTCTWKRHLHFRLAITPAGGWTAQSMEDALHKMPLDAWKCSTLKEDVKEVDLMV